MSTLEMHFLTIFKMLKIMLNLVQMRTANWNILLIIYLRETSTLINILLKTKLRILLVAVILDQILTLIWILKLMKLLAQILHLVSNSTSLRTLNMPTWHLLKTLFFKKENILNWIQNYIWIWKGKNPQNYLV